MRDHQPSTDDDSLPESDDPLAWIDWTTRKQALASDPQRSAWVSANAGSGKTHVLTQRVIRLLLAGARPSSILCLTYTRAAASEMSNRVFDRLAEWATLSERDLASRIEAIERRPPNPLRLAEARRLFARALETPGGLKIQTIHAFCEALLHQFPLEANVAGHFSVLDDRAASALLAEARRSLLTATAAGQDPELAAAFAEVLGFGDEFGLEGLLGDIIANRHAVRHFLTRARAAEGVDAILRRGLGIEPETGETDVAAAAWPLPGLSGPSLTRYIDLARDKGGVTVREIADKLQQAVCEADPFRRLALLEAVFLTAKSEPKKEGSLIAAAMIKAAPDLVDALVAARDHVVDCVDRLRAFRLYKASRAALVLADRLGQDYEDLKKRSSQLDFEDLIARAADLLGRADVGPWVHYKLDQGIDHILVDEAQDTSPIQWSVIRSLRSDFFSGQSARQAQRSFFAVGDEKQSIYSFQGARPERFSLEAREAAQEVARGGQAFSAVRLPLSFRSTGAVLAAVDRVFADPDTARGLSAGEDAVVHMSSRTGHPGAVEVWDMIVPEPPGAEEDWTAPFDATPESAPPAVLARRLAQRIETMLAGETIIEKGVTRPVEPGDILILVRKRGAFVTALTRALKRRNNIPVAGADRLRLTGHIAVQDLMALGRTMLLPADDLSLAALLKSPLFDCSEEQIFSLAADRGDLSLYRRLRQQARAQLEDWPSVAARLEIFQALARALPPHDFFARVLGQHQGRKRFLARLGSEVSDILDEFLTFALTHEQSGLPGLQSFITTLELEAPEVKREQDKERSEVRIMTVHASKGLEAPVVFLVDDGAKAFQHSHIPKFRMVALPSLTRGDPDCPLWVAGKTVGGPAIRADVEQRQRATEEEYRRLLYVGMTRAADRLIVCGYRGKTDNPAIWHRMVRSAFAPEEGTCFEETMEAAEGPWTRIVFAPKQDHERIKTGSTERQVKPLESLPEALLKPVPPSTALPRPLSPSNPGVEIDEGAGDLLLRSPLFDLGEDAGLALERGRLAHRMLQLLPSVPVADRPAAARRYGERAAATWPASERDGLISAVLAILDHPALTCVFAGQAEAELSVMGTIRLGEDVRAVSARVDRLAVDDDTVTVLDYKTNRRPPASEADVPFGHLAQLAIYRELLRPLYPGRRWRSLLVYTEGPLVIEISPERLSHALQTLQTHQQAHVEI